MSSRFSNKYPIPEKFPEILHDFSREVLRYMPKDILDFSVQYFYSLEIGSPLNYIEGGSKNIPKSLDLEKKDLKRQDISTKKRFKASRYINPIRNNQSKYPKSFFQTR